MDAALNFKERIRTMINKAIAKITEECQGKDYLIPFEEYLTSICTTDKIAEKILDKKKTLQGAFDEMKGIAKERQHGGCAYIPPEEGFGIIREYFGIDLEEKAETNIIDITEFL